MNEPHPTNAYPLYLRKLDTCKLDTKSQLPNPTVKPPEFPIMLSHVWPKHPADAPRCYNLAIMTNLNQERVEKCKNRGRGCI